MEDTIVQPLGTKVYAAEVKKERRTASGLILDGASSVKETAAALILAVGDEVTTVKVGDKVYIDWAKTKLVVIDGQQRVVLDEEDILAITQ